MTRRFRAALILGAALLILPACQPTAPGDATAESAAQEPSKVDLTFVSAAAPLELAEIGFGQLAAAQANNPSVRSFATKIVADHTAINRKLVALAQGKGMATPSDMDEHHQVSYHELQAMKGPAFDRAYLNAQLQDLTMLIQTFQAEADSGADAQLRGLAQQCLPTVQQHLHMALEISDAGV
jgi:putative membrane protein